MHKIFKLLRGGERVRKINRRMRNFSTSGFLQGNLYFKNPILSRMVSIKCKAEVNIIHEDAWVYHEVYKLDN